MESNKKSNSDSNSNNNTNTNNVHVNVNVDKPKRTYTKKAAKPNWYARTVIGGIIALALSLCGYLIKKNMDEKADPNSLIVTPNNQPVKPNN